MSRHEITSRGSNTTFTIDESVSEQDMRRLCPTFFRHAHGKRETYSAYRGFLIVRNTVRFAGGPNERRTVVYLWDAVGHDTHCVSHKCDSVRQAERLIDHIIDRGGYDFDQSPPGKGARQISAPEN